MAIGKNYHVIQASYLGATGFKGTRVKLYSERFRTSKVLSYDYSGNDIAHTAEKYLKSKGFTILGKGETKNGYAIISSTFKDIR